MGRETARVLLVDDDRVMRRMYSDYITNAGFRVTEEASAIDALERLTRGEEFEVVVTDVMMAKMDGWEFLDRIRKDLQLGDLTLPVIVISAHFDSDKLRAEAFRRGASATYTKAEPLSRLINAVKIHTGTMRSRFDDDTEP